ncbi:MAG: hypothetical protein ACREPX_02815 [Rhodanobacteraceae bacterium]
MTATQIIMLAVNASMFLIVFSIGLHATLENATFLFRQPGLFFRSILAMNIIMFVLAAAVALLVDLPLPVQVALVALALSPVPPILPSKQLKVGGSEYTIGLLVAASICSVVLVPLALELLQSTGIVERRLAMGAVSIGIDKVAPIVLMSIVIPLLAGILVNRFAPAFAARIARPISTVATILLVVAFIPVLYSATPMFWHLVYSGVLISLILFTVVGVIVGHVLGGPVPENRSVLALATSARHPGIALAIASINFADEKAVMAVVMYHLIIASIIVIPYVRWRSRLRASP